jgi:hypothetical protein
MEVHVAGFGVALAKLDPDVGKRGGGGHEKPPWRRDVLRSANGRERGA